MSKTALISVVLLVISIGLAVSGQLTMKSGMKRVVDRGGDLEISDFKNPLALVKRIAVDGPLALMGVLLYAVSAVFWLVVLSRVNLSVAYPMVAAGYVVVVFYSWLVFKEDVRWFSWIGLALIVAGVVVTAQGLKSGPAEGSGAEVKGPGVRVSSVESPTRGVEAVTGHDGIGDTD